MVILAFKIMHKSIYFRNMFILVYTLLYIYVNMFAFYSIILFPIIILVVNNISKRLYFYLRKIQLLYP